MPGFPLLHGQRRGKQHTQEVVFRSKPSIKGILRRTLISLSDVNFLPQAQYRKMFEEDSSRYSSSCCPIYTRLTCPSRDSVEQLHHFLFRTLNRHLYPSASPSLRLVKELDLETGDWEWEDVSSSGKVWNSLSVWGLGMGGSLLWETAILFQCTLAGILFIVNQSRYCNCRFVQIKILLFAWWNRDQGQDMHDFIFFTLFGYSTRSCPH